VKKNSLLLLGILFSRVFCCVPAHGETSPLASPPPAKTAPAKPPQGLWNPIVGEGVRAGLERLRLKKTTDRLARAGISPETGRLILVPAFDAARQGLPWESVLAKVDEGLLKKVGPEALSAAARSRADSLAKAQGLVVGVFGKVPSREIQALVAASALALESGVTEAALVDVFVRGKGKPMARVRAVVEAGEALHLAGVESDAVEALMDDCLVKNLRRQEILHVVRFAVTKKRQGMTGMAIRQAVWEPPARGQKAPVSKLEEPPAAPVPEAQPSGPVN
jgi:hypothetical protein